MKNRLSFYRKLKKLIKDECPPDCRIVYDNQACELYVIKKGYEFFDNETSIGGTSWHGVLSPVNAHNGDTGNDIKAVVGEGIPVDLEAVQQRGY